MALFRFLRKFKIVIILFLVTILFISSFSFLILQVEKEKIAEKFIDQQIMLELIESQMIRIVKHFDNFWENFDFYVDTVVHSLQFIDDQQMTFAAMYDKDLVNISARNPSYAGFPFDPLEYPEFVNSIRENMSGTIILRWGIPERNIENRDLYICYRWITSEVSDLHLMVIGISKYSISSPSLNAIIVVPFLIFFLSFVILFGFIVHFGLYMHKSMKRKNTE